MEKIKGLFLADLAAFAVCAVGMSVGHAPTVTASALVGVGASSVLIAKVPDKKSKESEILDKLLASQSKVEALQSEKDWELKLAKTELENQAVALKKDIRKLEEDAIKAYELYYQDKKNLEGKHKENIAKIERKYQGDINKKESELKKTVSEYQEKLKALETELATFKGGIEARETVVRTQSEQLAKFKAELEKANVELGLREKELRIEEKRIKLDIRETQGNLKDTLKNAELEVQVRDTVNARLQAELAELRQINRELWAEKYAKESDNNTAQIQAVLASSGCPTEVISSDSSGCKLKPLSMDGWDKKRIESAAQQIPGFVDLENPPKVRIKGGCIELVYDYQEPVKPSLSKALKFYDWNDAKDEASGFIVAGNTGSGKTAVVLWLLGLLTEDKPKQVLILDVHALENHWHEYGLQPIYKQDEVIAAIKAVLAELKRRKETSKNRDELIVCIDEVAATKINALDKEEREFVTNALLLIGAEGRKFGIILIAMNQSKNVAALGIDGQNRNNYFLILLCAAARDYAELQWGSNDERTRYVLDNPYSCVVSGSVSDAIAIHPTHGEYHRFVKKGLAPKNLKPINALTPVIEGLTFKDVVNVPCEVLENTQPALMADDKLSQIKRFWAEGERRLTVIIPAVWGCKTSGREYRKARMEFKRLTAE